MSSSWNTSKEVKYWWNETNENGHFFKSFTVWTSMERKGVGHEMDKPHGSLWCSMFWMWRGESHTVSKKLFRFFVTGRMTFLALQQQTNKQQNMPQHVFSFVCERDWN